MRGQSACQVYYDTYTRVSQLQDLMCDSIRGDIQKKIPRSISENLETPRSSSTRRHARLRMSALSPLAND
jgi:hypothetical protein